MKPQSPFGIISIKHTWPNSMAYNKESFTLSVEYEPQMTAAYFWAQQFWFQGGDGGYFGIQSDGDINGKRQKIAIFSIWGATGCVISGHTNASAEPFGHEGSGFSCKIPLEWIEGCVYKLELVKYVDSEKLNSWQAYITDIGNNKTFLIGTIIIPSNWGNLKPESNFFVEYFRAVSSCQDTPYQKSVYGNVTMNNGLEIASVNSIYETYGECANIGSISKIDTRFTIETGMKR